MSDHIITKLKQKGNIYFWKYKTKRSGWIGWHTTADKDSCNFIIRIIQMMLDSIYSSYYNFQLSVSDEKIVAVPNFNEQWTSAKRFSLIYPKNKVEPKFWNLEQNIGEIKLTVGEEKLKELQNGFKDVLNNEGDYAIGPESDKPEFDKQQLFFWWHLKS